MSLNWTLFVALHDASRNSHAFAHIRNIHKAQHQEMCNVFNDTMLEDVRNWHKFGIALHKASMDYRIVKNAFKCNSFIYHKSVISHFVDD